MKIVLTGCLANTPEFIKQIEEAFQKEFGVKFTVLGSYETLPGMGGEGGRSDVVVDMPDTAVPKAAIHPWHLNGLFRWYDDYYDSNKSIIPKSAKTKFFKKEK